MEKFSVLMSVYFKEKPEYLDLALESVFNQTIKPNEVVLVEDGKLTKELDKVIEKYEKKYRKILKVVKYEQNRGLGIALHDGLLECSNEIVFRMDTDDICDKNRFEKQLKAFKEKNVDVVGSNITEFDEEMKHITGIRIVKEKSEDIKKMAKKRNPINHMTVGFKKSRVINSGNYESMLYFEDYYLWVRMIEKGYNFYNLQENLVNVRGGNSMIKRRGGIKYIRSIVTFEKTLLKMKFINLFEFFINISERIFFSIVPNNFRATLYKNVLRK
ncbi:MAG: glycosyltransferase [Bacilli bacterium]|nr:glycosyltransferase [Bacilli bacterium]